MSIAAIYLLLPFIVILGALMARIVATNTGSVLAWNLMSRRARAKSFKTWKRDHGGNWNTYTM